MQSKNSVIILLLFLFSDITISDDFMFGIVMRDPKYCKPFLETILNIKITRS